MWECEDTSVRVSYFFPRCEMGKMKIFSNDFLHAYDCYVDHILTIIITITIMIIISTP